MCTSQDSRFESRDWSGVDDEMTFSGDGGSGSGLTTREVDCSHSDAFDCTHSVHIIEHRSVRCACVSFQSTLVKPTGHCVAQGEPGVFLTLEST